LITADRFRHQLDLGADALAFVGAALVEAEFFEVDAKQPRRAFFESQYVFILLEPVQPLAARREAPEESS
jgi:hypothetical protein